MDHISLNEAHMGKVDLLIRNMMDGTRGLLRDYSSLTLSLDAEHRRMLDWIQVLYCSALTHSYSHNIHTLVHYSSLTLSLDAEHRRMLDWIQVL